MIREDITAGDDAGTSVVTSGVEWNVGGVQLTNKDTVSGDVGSDVGTDDGLVRVVVRDVHAGGVVLEVQLGDVRGDECSSVGGNGGLVTVSGQVGVVLRQKQISTGRLKVLTRCDSPRCSR